MTLPFYGVCSPVAVAAANLEYLYNILIRWPLLVYYQVCRFFLGYSYLDDDVTQISNGHRNQMWRNGFRYCCGAAAVAAAAAAAVPVCF